MLDQFVVNIESHSNGVNEIILDEAQLRLQDRLLKGALSSSISSFRSQHEQADFFLKVDVLRQNSEQLRPAS